MTENLAFQQHLFSEPLFAGVLDESKLSWIIEKGSALFLGNALTILKQRPDNSIQTVITSPPYWSLREYCIEGQIGLESSVFKYIEILGVVLDEVKRVLKKDGTLWLNIGDSYISGGRKWRAQQQKLSTSHVCTFRYS